MALGTHVGDELRQARERRGVTLEVLAHVTKISRRILHALEQNDPEHVPGGLFIRGFLRAYAHEVGLDPEDTVTQYLAQFQPEPLPTDSQADEVEDDAGFS